MIVDNCRRKMILSGDILLAYISNDILVIYLKCYFSTYIYILTWIEKYPQFAVLVRI